MIWLHACLSKKQNSYGKGSLLKYFTKYFKGPKPVIPLKKPKKQQQKNPNQQKPNPNQKTPTKQKSVTAAQDIAYSQHWAKWNLISVGFLYR